MVFNIFFNLNTFSKVMLSAVPNSVHCSESYICIFCLAPTVIWVCYTFIESVSCSVVSNSLQPRDCSPPGSSVHGILQARILEWVAISFYRSSWLKDETWLSYITGIFLIIWATREATLSLDRGNWSVYVMSIIITN